MNKMTIVAMIVFLSTTFYVAGQLLGAKQSSAVSQAVSQAGVKFDSKQKLTSKPVSLRPQQPKHPAKGAVPAWSFPSDNNKIPIIASYTRDIPNAVLLKITELRSNSWKAGDHIEFYVPQIDYTLTSKIEERKEHAGGVVTLKSYPGKSMLNNVLVTLGQKNTFVNLFTPSGEYELVGNLEHGWLMPSAAIGPRNSALDAENANAEPVYVDDPVPKEPQPII
ncbi:MAG: hypothetical protein HOI74_11170 [Gammaproteobacteria bacterium]|jgi:hypothetical protein|nr:hypothetical protein [Gammaproteobacteria bacterium]MBT5724577.1 hypothetical protein [Gammaproteobacteria bacterium]